MADPVFPFALQNTLVSRQPVLPPALSSGMLSQPLQINPPQFNPPPFVSPLGGKLTAPILPSLNNRLTSADMAVVSPVSPTQNSNVFTQSAAGTSSQQDRDETAAQRDAMPSYDRFDDFTAAMSFGMKNAATLGMFGLDPISLGKTAQDAYEGHAFSANYDQAMSKLGLDFDTVQHGMAFSKGVDLNNTTKGSDVGGNFGPSSMPNGINDPGAMSAKDLGNYAREMNAAAAVSAAQNNGTLSSDSLNGFGGGGYGSVSASDPTGGYSAGSLSSVGANQNYSDNYSAGLGNFGGATASGPTSSGGFGFGGGYTSESPGVGGGGGGADGNNGAGSW